MNNDQRYQLMKRLENCFSLPISSIEVNDGRITISACLPPENRRGNLMDSNSLAVIKQELIELDLVNKNTALWIGVNNYLVIWAQTKRA